MRIWIDGSGWNGKTSKYAIVFEDGHVIQENISEKKTNNEMEYTALIIALEQCKEQDQILTDSQLIVGQTIQGWKCNVKHLQPLMDKAQKLIKDKKIILQWIPREENHAGQLLENLRR